MFKPIIKRVANWNGCYKYIYTDYSNFYKLLSNTHLARAPGRTVDSWLEQDSLASFKDVRGDGQTTDAEHLEEIRL